MQKDTIKRKKKLIDPSGDEYPFETIDFVSTPQVIRELGNLDYDERLIVRGVPNEVYHNGLPGRSSTQVKRAMYSGRAIEAYKKTETPAQKFGTLFHEAMELLVENESDLASEFVKDTEWGELSGTNTNVGRVERRLLRGADVLYHVGGSSTEQAKACREAGGFVIRKQDEVALERAKDIAAGERRVVISEAEYDVLSIGAETIANTSFFKQLLARDPYGHTEYSVFYRTHGGLLLKVRPDWWITRESTVVDWKTSKQVLKHTRHDDLYAAKVRACRSIIKSFQYDISAAMYTWITGADDFLIVLIDKEKREVYPCLLEHAMLDKAFEDMQVGIERLEQRDSSPLNNSDEIFAITEDYY